MNAPMTRRRRRRLAPLALAAGVLGSAILGLGATGTYSAITATITNQTNTAGTGSLVMKETDSNGADSGSCSSNGGTNNTTNSYSCSAFNKYGGSSTLTPGGAASTTTIRIYDTGTLDPAAFSMTPGACTPSNNAGANDTANNICTQLKVSLTCQLSAPQPTSTVQVYTAQTLSSIANTAVDLKAKGCLPLKGGSVYTTFVFTVQLDSGAQNGVQGSYASQPIVWQFTA